MGLAKQSQISEADQRSSPYFAVCQRRRILAAAGLNDQAANKASAAARAPILTITSPPQASEHEHTDQRRRDRGPERNAHRPVISSPDRNPAKLGDDRVDDHKADFAVPLLGRSRPQGRFTAKICSKAPNICSEAPIAPVTVGPARAQSWCDSAHYRVRRKLGSIGSDVHSAQSSEVCIQ